MKPNLFQRNTTKKLAQKAETEPRTSQGVVGEYLTKKPDALFKSGPQYKLQS